MKNAVGRTGPCRTTAAAPERGEIRTVAPEHVSRPARMARHLPAGARRGRQGGDVFPTVLMAEPSLPASAETPGKEREEQPP